MKKKIILLTTFLISFIIFTDNVEAAKELTCWYNHGVEQPGVIVSQNSEGKRTYWTYSAHGNIQYAKKVESIKNEKMHACKKNNACLVENVSSLESCPTYLDYSENSETIDFSDASAPGYTKLYNSYKKAWTEDDINSRKILKASSLTKEEKENMYYCKYEHDIEFYIDKNNGNIYSTLLEKQDCEVFYIQFTKYTFNKYFKEYGCPASILGEAMGQEKIENYDPAKCYQGNAGRYYYFMEIESFTEIESKKPSKVDRKSKLIKQNIPKKEEAPDANINSCSDLFGEDLVKEINKVMDVIKIAVPILLLVFGIADFFKATFDNSEDEMKKNRDRFIKRIIAAVIIFLVPTFVNLILKLGNTVWSDINSDTCINNTE